MQNRVKNVFWLVFLLTTTPSCFAEISLASSTSLSTEGYFVLNWESDSALPLILRQAKSDSFISSTETSLPNAGSITITGLENGNYYFQVSSDAELSNTVLVQVIHHELNRAISFFGLGLVLFLVLISAIFIGERRSRVND